MSYNELEKELKQVPATWIPALLRTLIWRAVEKNVFKEGGLAYFVENTLVDSSRR